MRILVSGATSLDTGRIYRHCESMNKHDALGRFVRIRKIWTGENWDDGHIDNHGRFKVYRPDYPRAYSEGYALRSHVVWWLAHGRIHKKDTDLHHKDGNKLNDKLENLEVLSHKKHGIYHNPNTGPRIALTCKTCGKIFMILNHKIRSRRKEGCNPGYCSKLCYYKSKRSEKHKEAISRGLKMAYAEGRR